LLQMEKTVGMWVARKDVPGSITLYKTRVRLL
jgi:hypothetical protein